nr:hypothetical protein [Rhizobium sp. RM]
MRTELDFAPPYRSSIGFDRVFNLLSNTPRLNAIETWPAYDIVKTGRRLPYHDGGGRLWRRRSRYLTQERNVLAQSLSEAGWMG